MPKVPLRKIIKSELPFKFDGDSEDDEYFEKDDDERQSSVFERP
jgi:hypothetical protein